MKTFKDFLQEGVRQASDDEYKLAVKVLKQEDSKAKIAGLGVDSKTGNLNIETFSGDEYVYDVKKETLKKA